MRIVGAIALAALCAGCVTAEKVSFQAKTGQQAIVRDGQPALVSEKKNSIVIARPAGRQFQATGRPVFVVGIYNRAKLPQDFRVSSVSVTQSVNDSETALKVVTYEDLVQEERNRQVVAAIATGLAAGANSYSASRAGYYNSTVSTPRGTYHVSGYSPTAAVIAQSNANATNAEMVAATVERGQVNLANLEQAVIKDNTLLPGEWYGGQLHISPPVAEAGDEKKYTIAVVVGMDRHEIQIAQGPAR